MVAYVYMLRCSDDRYYVGSARAGLEQRVAEHNSGLLGGFTKSRRPVTLVYHQEFQRISDAVAAERQIKGWSRAKKEALMRGDFTAIRALAKRRTKAFSSFETRPPGAPQDEAGGGGTAASPNIE